MDTSSDKQCNYPCKYCDRTFRSLSAMIRHLQLKKTEFPCDHCTTLFTTECAYQYHIDVCRLQNSKKVVQGEEANETKTDIKLFRPPKEPKDGHEPKKLKTESHPLQMTSSLSEPELCDENMVDKEEKLAQILLNYNADFDQCCPVCNCFFDDIQRHGRSHGTAFLQFCRLKRQFLVAEEEKPGIGDSVAETPSA